MSTTEEEEHAVEVHRPASHPLQRTPPLPVPATVPQGRKIPRRAGLLAFAAALLAAAAFATWWNLLRPAPLEGFASGNGRIEATEIDVATKLPGRVEAVLVEEGDVVDEGQTLARIDAQSLVAQLQEAEAAIQQSIAGHRAARAALQQQQSLLRLAQKELERSRKLFDASAAPQDALDRRQSQLEASQAGMDQAMQQLEQAERGVEVARARARRLRIDIDDAVLVAPRRARVLYRIAEPGEVLAAGGKVLTLVEQDDVYMTLFLPEGDAAQLRIGAAARIRLDGLGERTWPASVSYVAPKAQFTPKQVETASEREKLVFKIKVQLPVPVDPVVKAGMRGTATVQLDPDAPWPDTLR